MTTTSLWGGRSGRSQWFALAGLTVAIAVVQMQAEVRADDMAAAQAAAGGAAVERHSLDIAAQPLDMAIIELSRQGDVVITAPAHLLVGKYAKAVQGSYSVREALEMLLQGTELRIRESGQGSLVIEPRQAGTGSVTEVDAVMVTATKTATRLQDTAMSITALTSQDIERKNLQTMNDYLRTVPGVNMIDMGPGRNTIIMRGIAADPQFENKSVGAYFGEIPVAGLSQRANDGGSSDFMMVDIARVEVLRGPQGTLYGSGSMGGTVRVIPNSADPNYMEGGIQMGYSSTAREGGPSHYAQGYFNLPLIEDRLALRAVAYRYDTSGFIRNVAETSKAEAIAMTGARAVNEGDIGANVTQGFRGGLLWRLTDALEVELLHATQKSSVKGRPDVDLTLGAYEQDRFLTPFGREGIEDDIRASNLLVRYDFGWSTLTSSSSWTSAWGASNRNFGGGFWEVTPVAQRNVASSDTFTQEIRLASNLDGRVQFVVGAYYEDMEVHSLVDNRWGGSPELQAANGYGSDSIELFANRDERYITQEAVFGELTVDLTDKLSVTGGGRFFRYDRTSQLFTVTPGFFSNGQIVYYPLLSAEEKEDSYKVNVSYKPNDDQLFYAQWSQGFRLGYPLSVPAAGTGCDANADGLHDDLGLPFPTQFDSDFLENTELGAKLTAFDRRLTVNMALYRIKWKGLPVFVGAGSPCGRGLGLNAGGAESKGFEVESSIQVSRSFRLDVGASVLNAELTANVLGFAEAGDRLPGMPKQTYNLGAQYDFVLGARNAYVRGDASYVGAFYGNVQQIGAEAGDYYQVNLKGGINFGRVDVSVFIHNLANSDALIWVDAFDPGAYRMRPRTIGFNVAYRF